MSVCADEDGDGTCELCGRAMVSVRLAVSTEAVRSLILRAPISCTYYLEPELCGAELEAVQYSLDGGWEWFDGTSFTIPNFFYPFKVRILDSTGTWTAFFVDGSGGVTRY